MLIKYRPIFRVIAIFIFLLVIGITVHAQDESTNPPDFGNGDVTDAPIDGGVSLLVAAGVAYGIKKYRKEKKQDIE